MDATPNLALPFILAAQAQKHVTHNESLLRLDALVQLTVLDRTGAAPPSAPADGQRHIVPVGATGAWIARDHAVAAWQDGAWMFYPPQTGWRAWVDGEAIAVVFDGAAWQPLLASAAASTTLARAPHGGTTVTAIAEEELALAGATVDSTITIPDRALVLAVSTRTTEAITGAASYDCGIPGDTAKYGGLLGTAAGSTNSGVTGPTAFYAPTTIRLTANGGTFTGGKVRIAIHHMLFGVPTN